MNGFARRALAFALACLVGWGSARAETSRLATQHSRHVSHAPRHRRSADAHLPKLANGPGRAGFVVAWDPESHTFTMPAPDRSLPLTAAERNALSRSFTGLVEVRHPDGSVSVDLQGRFQDFAVVHLGPDGKPVYRCLDDTAQVRRALHEPMTASGLEER